MTLSEKPTGSGQSESQPPGLLLILRLPPQLGASAKRGCVTGTATARTTRTRRTVRPWPAGHPHIPVPTTPPSACPLTSCVTAKTTAEMARTRASCAVRVLAGPGQGSLWEGVWGKSGQDAVSPKVSIGLGLPWPCVRHPATPAFTPQGGPRGSDNMSPDDEEEAQSP